MKICLDVTPLVQPKMTGVQIVTRDIVMKLLEGYPQDKWTLFAAIPRGEMEQFKRNFVGLPSDLRKVFVPLPARMFHFVIPRLQEWYFPPLESVVGPIDHYHSFEWFHFPTLASSSATLQDWSPMMHPEWVDEKNLYVFKSRWQAMVKSKAKIAVISDFIYSEVAGMYPDLVSRLKRIYNGVPIDCASPSVVEIFKALNDLKITSSFFLSVGTLNQRKNYTTLIQAYRRYRAEVEKPFDWVVVANISTHDQSLKNEPGVIHLKQATRAQIMALYSRAQALLFASWYEAFGLPLLEAMVCGCPVISSDLPAAHEVGGSQFVYIPAGDVEGWVRTMKLPHAKTRAPNKFSLDKIAQEYRQLFDTSAGKTDS